MRQHVLLYIKQGLKAYQKAISPIIIIEDRYLQTFVHTLALNVCGEFFKRRMINAARSTDVS